jgi:hypothetical protein
LLKYSLSISEDILVMLTHGTELENSFVRVERCESATHLPKENFGKELNEPKIKYILLYKKIYTKKYYRLF